MELKPVRKILLPFDFSLNSRKAINYAVSMAEKINCRILIHHVYKIPVVVANEYVMPETDEKFAKDAKSELEKFAMEVRKAHPEVYIETSFTSGLVVDEILHVSSEKEADMIIMGTRGAHGLEASLFGSNTADIIGKSSVPVLAIPQEALYKSLNRVVFTTSFIENDFQTLFQLVELLKPFNPVIEVIHVEEKGEKPMLNQLMEEFSAQVKNNIPYKNILFKVIEGHNVEHAIEEYVESGNIDLMAIASRRRNFFERLTERSLSRKLAFHTRIPLLVFHSFNKTSYPIL